MYRCKIYTPGCSGAGCSGVQSSLHQNGLACRSYIFTPILNFSSEMESDNISLPLIACQERESKIFKILITLTYLGQACSCGTQKTTERQEVVSSGLIQFICNSVQIGFFFLAPSAMRNICRYFHKVLDCGYYVKKKYVFF